MKDHQKINATFRLDLSNFKQIQREAEIRRTSVNALINQMMEMYVSWHFYAGKANMIPIPQKILTLLFVQYKDADIVKMAKDAAREFKDVVMLLRGNYDVDSFLSVIDTWSTVSEFSYTHKIDDSLHRFVIQHNLGKKGSVFLINMFDEVFSGFDIKKEHYDLTENSITIAIDTKSTS